MAFFDQFSKRINSPHYTVLVGDVGTGKSSVVEKLTGAKGRSSNADESFTKTSKTIGVPDGSLYVCDTPGSNPIQDKLKHNTEIAAAFNYDKVSKIFIVTKADTRIDNVVDNVRKYAEQLMELDMDVLGIMVTHMDTVTWSEKRFSDAVNNELGIETVVYSALSSPSAKLQRDILAVCSKRHDITINGDNFFKIFKIHSNNLKILRTTKREVEAYRELKSKFETQRQNFSPKDQVDLIYEFQAWMAIQIIEAQKRMASENNFNFSGEGAANQAGHLANMSNQLRVILHDLRIEALGHHIEHGVDDLRKCPHCGLIWAKIEGCDGSTTCGERPSEKKFDLRDGSDGVMSTFTFNWRQGAHSQLFITKSGSKKVQTQSSSSGHLGCGKSINWNDMAQVEVPQEFQEGALKASTDDIKIIPDEASEVKGNVDKLIRDAERKMKMGQGRRESPF